jgi:lysophospholipase L1-like esterase
VFHFSLVVLAASNLALVPQAAVAAAPEEISALVTDPCPPPSPPDPQLAEMTRQLIEPGHDVVAMMNALVAKGASQPGGGPMAEMMKTIAERRARDWPELCHYAAENRSITKPVKVVLMGDSITENWKAADPKLFTNGIANRGISGQSSGQMLLRFYADVIALHPSLVHIMAGTNDIGGATGLETEQTFKNNIMAMAELARLHHIRVVLASIPPAGAIFGKPSYRPAKQIIALNAWLRTYAHENGLGYVDYHTALTAPDGSLRRQVGNDYVHPNAIGYGLMRSLFLGATQVAGAPAN